MNTEEKMKNAELQRRFKSRMYEAGFAQKTLWVKLNRKFAKISMKAFIERLEKLSPRLGESEMPKLYDLFLQIMEGKLEKEAMKKGK